MCWHTVVASERGVVVGRLTYQEDGDEINCQRMGIGGKAIPSSVDKVRTSHHESFSNILRLSGAVQVPDFPSQSLHKHICSEQMLMSFPLKEDQEHQARFQFKNAAVCCTPSSVSNCCF